jgi:hypothetical protein
VKQGIASFFKDAWDDKGQHVLLGHVCKTLEVTHGEVISLGSRSTERVDGEVICWM